MLLVIRLLSFLGISIAVSSGLAAQDLGRYETEAESVLQRLRGAMMAEMQKAMAIGPAEAISVCRHLAPEIEAQIEEETGWEVRRTSLKVRNPDNTAHAAEHGVLLSYAARSSAGQNPALMRTIRLLERDGTPTVHFMQAVPMFGMCIACHGADIAPEVKAAIDDLYPDDHAVGYDVGQIRGAFSLFKPFDAEALAFAVLAEDDSWAEIEALILPDAIVLEETGKVGDPVAGRDAYKEYCRSCHAPVDLATDLFGPTWPADKPSLCVILNTHGLTDAARDCDIAAFLQALATTDLVRAQP